MSRYTTPSELMATRGNPIGKVMKRRLRNTKEPSPEQTINSD